LIPGGVYSARFATSLQIRRWYSDLSRTVRAENFIREQSLTVAELMAEAETENPYGSIAIYRQGDNQREPIVWVELLSPANKSNGFDREEYMSNRYLTLQEGIVLVELDFLHESHPLFASIPDYSSHADQSHPYRIVLLDPRDDFQHDRSVCAEFDVDEPLPTIVIPLDGPDVLEFDFNAAYQRTYTGTLYGPEFVDYSQLPLNFDRYSPADQTRIACRMLSVLEAAHAGTDLETGPFLVKDIPLDAALEQITSLMAALNKG
jgi:hypothetical protein